MFAERVSLSPDPFGIARLFSGEPDVALVAVRAGPRPACYVACGAVERSEELDPEPSLALSPALGAPGASPRWIGLLPYEAFRGLESAGGAPPADPRPEPHVLRPLWLRYPAVVRVDRAVTVVGDDRAAVRRLAARLRGAALPASEPFAAGPLVDPEPDGAHAARIEAALERIREGEIYQVNLAKRLAFPVAGAAVELLAALQGRARAPHLFALESRGLTVAGASPELLLSLDGRGRLHTLPIKGTRPRGVDAASDRALAAELDADPKERAELAMVVDVERNDLARIARRGSVRVEGAPRVVTTGPVHHRVARVAAALADGVPREAILRAFLPSGSVTGAPKARAMELLAGLEASRRGLYTGGFGVLGHDGSLALAMAIRTLTARDGLGHYGVGGGIVLGSDPAREVEETRWKAAQLLGLLGGGRTGMLSGWVAAR